MEDIFMYTVVPQKNSASADQLTDKLLSSAGVQSATVSKTEGRVYVRGTNINQKVIENLIAQSGYEVQAARF